MDNKLNELIELLLLASETYYQDDFTVLTDEEYDDKLEYLRSVTLDDESLLEDERVISLLEGSVAGGSSPVETSELIAHNVPMLSLAKANSMSEMKTWYDRVLSEGGNGFQIQAKLDGFAIEARYKDKKGYEIGTRGDGSVGENMSYLFNHPEITIKGLPSHLKNIEECELRGELFAKHSQFDKFNKARKLATGEEFKNSRNGVVGVVKKGKGGLGYKAELTFVVYSLLVNGEYHDLSELYLNQEDVITINELTKSEWIDAGELGELTVGNDFPKLMDLINSFGGKRPMFDIPTDGAVLKPLNEAQMFNKMGSTSHHPVAFIAFKYPGEKAKTTVLDIELSVGKTGRVTPVAIVEPTDLNGTTISRITCHNFNWMYEKGIKVGSTVMITRANDVIPAITTVVIPGDNDFLAVPTDCPECGEALLSDGLTPPKTLKCVSNSCPSRLFFSMRTATSKQGFDIDGLNNVGLLALCESNKVKDVASLFTLTPEDLEDLVIGKTSSGNPRKFGKVRARKIINLIEKAKTSTPAYKLMNTLGLDGLGPSTFKMLLAHFNSVESVLNATQEDLENIAGFGEVRIENLLNDKANAIEIYNELVEYGVKVDNGLSTNSAEKNGKSFAISGKVPDDFKNRQEFVDYMESNGWSADSSPKKTTTVVFGDENDTSSKIAKAKKLNIEIVSPNDYKSV